MSSVRDIHSRGTVAFLSLSLLLSSFIAALAFDVQESFAAIQPVTDFNGDGYEDLAIGVPNEGMGAAFSAGAVNVLYGSASNLTSTGDQFWHQNSTGVQDMVEAADFFGTALAAGDFNNDGYSDLAIGVPGEDIGGIGNAGAVNVLYGSAAGLTQANDQFWHQDVRGVEDTAETDDSFGEALSTGDFNNDGYDDLAIGVKFESINGVVNMGAVNVLYGSASGLTQTGDQLWHQDIRAIEDAGETDDQFGFPLAAGDFNNDGYDDLAVGSPFEDTNGSGAVNVLYGSASGLTATGDQFWDQDVRGVEDVAEDDDFFGRSLATGDFNNDGYDDLAIGSPSEDINGIEDAGVVNVLYGSAAGLTATGDQLWHQDVRGVEDVVETGDRFGHSLVAGDFNNDGYDDLVVGSPDEDGLVAGITVDSGAVNVLYGSAVGLTSTGDQLWHQDVRGVEDVPELDDEFGHSLSTGDFNNDGYSDLAIGVRLENIGGISDAGAVNVLYGSASGLTATSDQLWHQDVRGVEDLADTGDRFGNFHDHPG